MNEQPEFKSSSGPVARFAIRPTLHSIDQIVHALVPYYGWNCPISAISMDPVHANSRIEGTLANIAGILANNAAFSRPVLVIR